MLEVFKMSGKTVPKAIEAAISGGFLGPCLSLVPIPGTPQNAALFYDLEEFEAGFDRATQAFGRGKFILGNSNWVHC